MYLPVTLEIDEPEQLDVPVGMGQVSQSQDPETSPSSKKVKTVDIVLRDAPKDGNYPGVFNIILLSNFRVQLFFCTSFHIACSCASLVSACFSFRNSPTASRWRQGPWSPQRQDLRQRSAAFGETQREWRWSHGRVEQTQEEVWLLRLRLIICFEFNFHPQTSSNRRAEFFLLSVLREHTKSYSFKPIVKDIQIVHH